MPAIITIRKHYGSYTFTMTACNGDRVIQSTEHKSEAMCRSAIHLLKEIGAFAHSYEKKTEANRQYYFVVKDKDEKVLATSELFWSASSRDYAITIVKRECQAAVVSN